MKLKRLTINSMLIALYIVLSILTPVKLQNFEFTFEALPIIFAGLAYGPLDGFTVGALGETLYQLFFSQYGITATTILWIIPHAISGLLVGTLAKHYNYKIDTKKAIIITIISAITVTALNTLALYIDAKVYGYYSKALVFALIPIKIICGIILAIIYSIIVPKLIKIVKTK